MPPKNYVLEVQARLPDALKDLHLVANNLLYAWDRHIRGLFWHMDRRLWEQCKHSPKLFLRRISQQRLDELTVNPTFLEEYRHVMSLFHSYRERTREPHALVSEKLQLGTNLVAYFCAEYGLHESLPLYSGGLGILAGDYCKAAGGMGLPFTGIGLMYRQGYFRQRITRDGAQEAELRPHNLSDLPIELVTDDSGQPVTVSVPMADRSVQVQIWRVAIGRLELHLLDTDVEGNSPRDRAITYQLYGGDRRTRMEQELILGVGGVRTLRDLNLAPDAWHINEGHAAFLIIERCREAMETGLDFDTALESVAAATLFTTHTPVPAGHDMFEHELAQANLAPYAKAMGIELDTLLALGASPHNHGQFNMTALGLRGSRYHNGVSAIHRDVAARMESYIWPQIPPEENPLQHVTNGVHVQTFLGRQWANLLDVRAPEWRERLGENRFWKKTVEQIPDHVYWSHRMTLKQEMLSYVCEWLERQYRRQQLGTAHIERCLRQLHTRGAHEPLVMTFARRFATYKRATLLLQDPERLARMLNDPQRPVVLFVAGKAHPADKAGQDMIRTVVEFSNRPEFIGRLFFLEDYDLSLSRKLVIGSDVWLNMPIHPMEACGTSGQKAGLNGALNVSILDGWWDEGYDGENGWAITPYETEDQHLRERYEAEELYDVLEDEVIPLYFDMGREGYSPDWVRRSKSAMKTTLPRFNSQRMLLDYIDRLYLPTIRHGRRLASEDHAAASDLAQWKRRTAEAWPGVKLSRVDGGHEIINSGDQLKLEIKVELNGLKTEDVRLETVLVRKFSDDEPESNQTCYPLEPVRSGEGVRYALELSIDEPGLYRYSIRAYPWHSSLAHPFETGLMIWL